MPGPKTRLKKTTTPAIDNKQSETCGSQKDISATQRENNIPSDPQSTEHTSAQPQPKKRSHQTAAIPDSVEDAPPAKKGRKVKDIAAAANDLPDTELIPIPKATRPARREKSAAAIGNTQDVPRRRRRTKEEVAADKEKIAASKEAKRQAAEDLIRKADEAKAFLAQMNIDEEEANAQMQKENLHRLSAVKRKRGVGLVEESEGESFDEVPPGSEESESEMEITVKKAPRTKKQQQGVRGDVEIIASKLRGGDNGGERKNAESLLTDKAKGFGTGPKKYPNAGLRANSNVKARPATSRGNDVEPALGGLDDEDAEAERPDMYPVKHSATSKLEFPVNLRRDKARRNELVGISIDSADDSEDNTLKAKPKNKSKPTLEKMTVTKVKVAKQAKVKEEGNLDVIRRMETKSPAMEDLLRDPRWTGVFLPSLVHALYISRKPFKHFKTRAPEFLQIVQTIFDLSYPEIDLALKSNDELVRKACQRMTVKKAKIASDILADVTEFFKTPEYANQQNKIREYAWWAVRGDGPGYHAQPTPLACKVSPKDEEYIKPDGFLRTKFLTAMAQKYLNFADKSVLKPEIDAKNPPKALYALMLVATERAFKAFLPNGIAKSSKDLEEFSDDNFARELNTFMGHIDKVGERRWQVILNDTREEDEENNFENGDLSLISEYRANIFIPSSPIKG